jgi:DNA-binding NtrC family response regulator
MESQIRESNPAQRPASPFRAKLLVVDEKLDELQYYSQVLQRAGYEVRSMASFADAATSLEHDSFDLIIASNESPNFTGRSVLARVIEQHRAIPLLVLDRDADAALYLEVKPSAAVDAPETLQPSEIAALVADYLPGASGKA